MIMSNVQKNDDRNKRQRDVLDIPSGANYYDAKFGTMVHKINEGGFCVLSQSDHLIMTTLGSCISVCIFDPIIKVGGMNHFLLPESSLEEGKNNFSLRYGNNAMETLVNEILKRGGKKERLVLKAFGAGNVINMKADIGGKNHIFLKQYIKDEDLKLETCDLGGDFPRWVIFYPSTGKAFVRLLQRTQDRKIINQEEVLRKKIEKQHNAVDIELF
ncbi:MAG: hypothetical protein K9G26_04100 [Emcibacter sp.]|nr:hypothetical protein [Emcibacter sp.]